MRIDYQPAWTPDGKELIYVASITSGLLAAVTVTSQPDLTFGRPVTFPSLSPATSCPTMAGRTTSCPTAGSSAWWHRPKPEARIASELRTVLNWAEELRRLAPVN